ncbi:MAG TPA: potassium/proton antiporter [Candidatus Kapabacteria bacterium]|jgi:cell volume regulation protein A
MVSELLIGSILLIAAIVFSRISARLSLPALVVFLFVGILAGPEGIGKLSFDAPGLTELIATLALIFILFSGGLETSWNDLRPVLGRGLLLATVGLLINAILVAWVMRAVFSISWLEGLLFGSIIGCTDAAAVFSVLRTRTLALVSGLGPMAELESASNDPMAVFLSLAIIELIKNPGTSIWSLIPLFFLQMGVGAVIGVLMGRVMPIIINRLNLEQEGLYPTLSIALAILTYGLTSLLHGSGFLAAYVAGIMMNTRRYFHKRSLARFHAGFAWLLQILMFLALGLLLRPSQLAPIAWNGIIISLFILFVARPVSVFLALAFSRLSVREKLMASWLGLRGAVPIILATLALYSGVDGAPLIFDLVFFVVLLSVIVQGMTLAPIARWLRVVESMQEKHRLRLHSGAILSEKAKMLEMMVPEASPLAGSTIMSLQLDEEAHVMLLYRDGATIIPTGRTRIHGGDVLVLLAPEEEFEKVRKLV